MVTAIVERGSLALAPAAASTPRLEGLRLKHFTHFSALTTI
jgi:hypothetical protein